MVESSELGDAFDAEAEAGVDHPDVEECAEGEDDDEDESCDGERFVMFI